MTSVYRTWVGKVPYAIIVDRESIGNLLYYETGFEQLHPLPDIHDWMSERNYSYGETWKVIRIDPDKANVSEWAICFNNPEIRDMFALRWL